MPPALHRTLACLLALTAIAAGAPAAGLAAPRLAQLGARAASGAPSASTASSTPLSPQQILTAYSLPATGARGQTIAVLSPFDDPTIQADLSAYSKRFRLPACTTANGCFRKLNEQGQAKPLPFKDPSGGQWITESALGVEIAHGLCQSCRIVLIETGSPSDFDVGLGADGAAKAGATVLVTSVTANESGDDREVAPHFSHPGLAVVAAAGDGPNPPWGFSGDVDFPALLPNVISVGGTVLSTRHGQYAGEKAWADTVSGCSGFQNAPSWQASEAAGAGCANKRAVSDVAAMSEPGAILHITGINMPGGPWFDASGTSLAAPIIAATIGLAGSLGEREAQVLYARAHTSPASFHDVVSGTNSPDCNNALCKAGPGWDGPTGLGSPFGLAAFLPRGGALSHRRSGISFSTAPGTSLRSALDGPTVRPQRQPVRRRRHAEPARNAAGRRAPALPHPQLYPTRGGTSVREHRRIGDLRALPWPAAEPAPVRRVPPGERPRPGRRHGPVHAPVRRESSVAGLQPQRITLLGPGECGDTDPAPRGWQDDWHRNRWALTGGFPNGFTTEACGLCSRGSRSGMLFGAAGIDGGRAGCDHGCQPPDDRRSAWIWSVRRS